jgi:copper oxidase (laccase) domain-containing protein
VGAAHDGWRGSAKNVAGEAVRALAALGAAAGTLRAWIGPSIGPCCYEVGGEVAAQFAGDFLRAGCGGPFRLDLKSVNAAQLQEAGVPREAIAIPRREVRRRRFASYRETAPGPAA